MNTRYFSSQRSAVLLLCLLTPIACAKEKSTNLCDMAVDLDRTTYDEVKNLSDEAIHKKVGRSRLYYEMVVGARVDKASIDQLKRAPETAQQVLASLSLAGNDSVLQQLFTNQLDPNSRSVDGVPLVVIAASCGRVSTVSAILNAGGDLYAHDSQNMDAMAISIAEDDSPMVRTLLDHGYKVNSNLASGVITERLARTLHSGRYCTLVCSEK